jgi:hypothetical protein
MERARSTNCSAIHKSSSHQSAFLQAENVRTIQGKMMPFRFLMRFLILVSSLVFAVSPALAQAEVAKAAQPDAVADAFADQTVRDWLAGKFAPKQLDLREAARLEGNQLIIQTINTLKQQLRFFPAPKEARVSFNLRRASERLQQRIYTYPITSSDVGDQTLTVTISKSGDAWSASSVNLGEVGSSIPEFVTTTWGGWLFAALSALLLYASLAIAPWRKTLSQSLQIVKEQRQVFIWTNVALYGLFAIGTWYGLSNPDVVKAIVEFLGTALNINGVAALTQSNVASAAFGITVNNARAAMLAFFAPGSLFAVPAYLFASGQMLFYGTALAPVGTTPLTVWLLHLPTIIIELQAYIFIVASSGAMLWRIIKRVPFGVAFIDYLRCLPLALSILVLAAWYEAFEIMVLIPAVLGR